MVKAAVILCGSGRFDGSEIQEAVLSLLHLERLGASWRAFAPDAAQWAVCEHFSGTASSEASRNQLIESARIARGNVAALGEARVEDFDLLVLPGGNGAARNLCDFAERGAAGTLRPELDALIQGFHRARKPIAAICIAPAIVALSIGKAGPRMTLGPATGEAAQAAAKTGAQFVDCSVDQVCVDAQHRIVSTPAYMLGPDLRSVDLGIALCIREAIRLCNE
jgi:enhancing lycopene biosynthesis protein 2